MMWWPKIDAWLQDQWERHPLGFYLWCIPAAVIIMTALVALSVWPKLYITAAVVAAFLVACFAVGCWIAVACFAVGCWIAVAVERRHARNLSDWCQSRSPEHNYQCSRATHPSGWHEFCPSSEISIRWLDDEPDERVLEHVSPLTGMHRHP